MTDTPWSPRHKALGGFAVGFLVTLFVQTFVFEETFGGFVLLRAVTQGVVFGLIFYFVPFEQPPT